MAAALLAGGCAASAALSRGRDAEQRRQYDAAVAEYTQAVRHKPKDTEARLALDRAKLRAAMDHFERGRRHDAVGRYEQALVEYEAAAELNPSSGDIDAAVRETRNKLRSKIAVSRDGKTELQTLIDRTRSLPAPGLDLPDNVKMPESLFFSGASSRLVFMAIGKIADISVGFDTAFREAPVTVDLRNTTLRDALHALSDQTRTFYRVTAPRAVLIIPDTPTKRREYEEEVVRVFYLSNADLKETMDLLRMVLDARRISPVTGTNALTVKDTPERVDAAARLLTAIDKARPEVIIDVELLEVDRTRLQEYGLQIASPGSPGLDGAVAIAPDGAGPPPIISLQSLRSLTQADVLFANLPNLYYRLLKTDTNTRTLANPQLRTMEGVTAQARFGERVPVPVTTFQPVAQGGLPIQPTTSFQYENIGVNIDITPRTHHEDEVTLVLRVAVQAVSGTGFGGLPTFANREINTSDPAARRRDEHAGRADPGRGAPHPRRHSGSERPAGDRANLRAQQDRGKSVRYHPDPDAAHHPRARRQRGGSPRLPRRPRCGLVARRRSAAGARYPRAGSCAGRSSAGANDAATRSRADYSGRSAAWFLRLLNAETAETLSRNLDLCDLSELCVE